MLTQRPFRIFWVIVICLLITGVAIQSHIFLSWDVAWHLETTKRWLAGGTYLNDFFDINPPMIMISLIPAVWLDKLMHLGPVITARFYFFTLGVMSLLLCQGVFKKLFLSSERLVHGIFLVTLAFVLFILPAYEFGNRSFLLLLGILPYCFSLALYLNHKTLGRWQALLIGLLAGFGFLMNAQFVLLFFALEIFLMIQQRSFRSFLRSESLLIMGIFLLYIPTMMHFAPEYLGVVLPLVAKVYVPTFNVTWREMFVSLPFFTACAALIVTGIHWKRSSHKPLIKILLVVLLASIIQFILTRKLWYYHMLPILTTSLFLFFLFLSENIADFYQRFKQQQSLPILLWIKTGLLCLLLITLPLTSFYTSVKQSIQIKNTPDDAMHQAINFVRRFGKKTPVYAFSTTVAPGPTLIDYADSVFASRFAGFWMLPGIVLPRQPAPNTSEQKALEAFKTLLINMVVADFTRYQPKVVFVDVARYKLDLGHYPFDYLQFFQQDPRFRRIWRQYRPLTKIAHFKVYVRR